MTQSDPTEIHMLSPDQMPLALLLEADPSESKVRGYLPKCDCYAALIQDQIVGVCLLLPLREGVSELINIAVSPEHQNLGIGKSLLNHVITDAKSRGLHKLELGTGTFGYQLSFYQKAGFRAESVDRDFFLTHYDEPLFEDGIQHKDMLRLGLELA